MKKAIFTLAITTLTMTSCLKSRTCTCKDGSGTVVSQTTTKTNKSGIKQFEDDCNKKKVSSGTTTYPCELS
ncbi:MAG: hypothetical protein JNJ41_00505 [Bacteroidia bacterium]|nr:hypothetical protein [Bacteroidia bacterium]